MVTVKVPTSKKRTLPPPGPKLTVKQALKLADRDFGGALAKLAK